MWAAGFTVLGALLITLHDPRVTRVAVLSGLAFAAALLMKPTFSPLVIILYGAAIALRFAPHIRDHKELLIASRSCLIIGGIALILAGPHYILALNIWSNIIVQLSLAREQPSGHQAFLEASSCSTT